MVSIRKTLWKTVTWRIIAVITTFIVAFMFTKQLAYSIEISLVANLIKTGLFFAHERLWERH